MEGILGVLVPIFITLGAFAMVFGLRYLSNKERMAMIERGMTPSEPRRSRPHQTLKWGLVIAGVGIGLFIAFFLSSSMNLENNQQTPIYFGMIGICGGLGLVISYFFERKHEEKEEQMKKQNQ